MTEQQMLEQLGLSLENLQSDMADLRSELKRLEHSITDTLTAAFEKKAEALIAGILYPLSQKLDEQPWHAVYSLNDKLGELRTDVYTLNEKMDAQLKAISLTEGVYGHVSTEIDRLDGYLNYHVDQLRLAILRIEGRADRVENGPT